jgi:hypothetical protein
VWSLAQDPELVEQRALRERQRVLAALLCGQPPQRVDAPWSATRSMSRARNRLAPPCPVAAAREHRRSSSDPK